MTPKAPIVPVGANHGFGKKRSITNAKMVPDQFSEKCSQGGYSKKDFYMQVILRTSVSPAADRLHVMMTTECYEEQPSKSESSCLPL